MAEVGAVDEAERPKRRWARRVALGLGATAAAWLALAIHPQPLFAFSAQRANVVLHARAPLAPRAFPILDEVVRRLARSPLYDPARTHHVFLCDTPSLYGLFTLWGHNSGGVTQTQFVGNVFIRPSSVERDRVIGPSGDDKPGERTLTYFITHEVTHAMTADRLGRWRAYRLAAFQREGYADYVGFDRPVDFPTWRAALARGAPEMSPSRSGLYRRHELLVAYLLERRGMSVPELLARPLDRGRVEADLLADGFPAGDGARVPAPGRSGSDPRQDAQSTSPPRGPGGGP
jgi:hypothetical protein